MISWKLVGDVLIEVTVISNEPQPIEATVADDRHLKLAGELR